MPKPRLTVRLLEDHEEFRQCERVQKNVWGVAGVTGEVLLVTQKYGGIVLGALARGKVVGFLYAFLARRSGELIHWSHMMAIEPGYRDRGLGLRLKLEHRRRALAQGLRSIAWTYDPLQSRNANLNVARLGARIAEYVPNCYGELPSLIERGLPTDRFVVDWRIASRRVERRLGGQAPAFPAALPRVNVTELRADGLLANRQLRLNLPQPQLLVEIPTHTDRMRLLDVRLARRWRLEMRRVFQHYLRAGCSVEDFLPPAPRSDGRAFYLLRRS